MFHIRQVPGMLRPDTGFTGPFCAEADYNQGELDSGLNPS